MRVTRGSCKTKIGERQIKQRREEMFETGASPDVRCCRQTNRQQRKRSPNEDYLAGVDKAIKKPAARRVVSGGRVGRGSTEQTSEVVGSGAEHGTAGEVVAAPTSHRSSAAGPAEFSERVSGQGHLQSDDHESVDRAAAKRSAVAPAVRLGRSRTGTVGVNLLARLSRVCGLSTGRQDPRNAGAPQSARTRDRLP